MSNSKTSSTSSGEARRHKWVILGVGLALAVGMQGLFSSTTSQAEQTAWQAVQNAPTVVTAASFADPPMYDKPWARWNWPPTWLTDAMIEADIQDAYDSGHGGLEVGQYSGNNTQNLLYSIQQWETIYNKANSLGIRISTKVAGTGTLPDVPGTPATFTATDDYVRRTLTFASPTVVQPGASLTNWNAGSGTQTIVAVVAYQCSSNPCGSSPYTVERDRFLELTSLLTGTDTLGLEGGTRGGTLNWTSTTTMPWVVVSVRAAGGGTNINVVPEQLSPQGTKILTDAYEKFYSTPTSKPGQTLGDLVKANGGDFFVDSHGNDPWGIPYELWSSNMRTEFQARAGYDIVANIMALNGSPMGSGNATVVYSDGSRDRIQNDFTRIRTDMFNEYRIEAFQNWAHTYNMSLRVQHEDTPATNSHDQLTTSAILDRTEHESLAAADFTDIFRVMASAQWMTGNQWYSTECCAINSKNYLDTIQDTMIRMNKEFAGGVERPVYHVRGSYSTNNSTWPGVSHTPTSKNAWTGHVSSDQPYWENMADVNAYYARSGQILRAGQAKVDVAVYMVEYIQERNVPKWVDESLQKAGYTWGYVNEALLNLDNAVVTNGVLAKDGPGYKVMVFSEFVSNPENSAKGTLTNAVATKMLGYALQGLPIVFIGSPIGTGSMVDSNATLNTTLTTLLARPNVYTVASEAALPVKLAEIGVKPNMMPQSATHLQSMNRYDPVTNTSYYWLYNYGNYIYDNHYMPTLTGQGLVESRTRVF